MSVSMSSLLCVIALSLSACATVQPDLKPADTEQWRESQRPVLVARAEARWGALIKGDLEKAYSYTTPEYRAVVSLQQDKAKYGRVLSWRMARAVNVSYDASTVATVSVEVTYRVDLPGTGGGTIETQKAITEKWIYTDREWWYTSS